MPALYVIVLALMGSAIYVVAVLWMWRFFTDTKILIHHIHRIWIRVLVAVVAYALAPLSMVLIALVAFTDFVLQVVGYFLIEALTIAVTVVFNVWDRITGQKQNNK